MTPKTAQITIRLQNIMMQLRKCCNHPYLLEYPLMADEQYRIDEDIVTSCGKMVLLDRMLKELKKKGHKVGVIVTNIIIGGVENKVNIVFHQACEILRFPSKKKTGILHNKLFTMKHYISNVIRFKILSFRNETQVLF